VILARPLAGWKLALVAAMVAAMALTVAVRALGHGIFLLDTTPLRMLVAGVLGVGGAALVELSYRAVERLHGDDAILHNSGRRRQSTHPHS
jgi:cation-transporting P-type ATPase E